MNRLKDKIRIGIIGCGRVAENHVLAIRQCPGTELTAVAGGRNADTFAREHGVLLLDRDEICSSDQVDAVIICTPPQYHFHYTSLALEHGKHVLVEKPVSFDELEIIKMQELAVRNGLVCIPGHSYLYLPELKRIKRVMERGGIGKAAYLYLSECYYMPEELFSKYEGPAEDVLCHQLYLSIAYLGLPRKISAFTAKFDKETIPTGGPQISVNMRYDSGALLQIMLSWAVNDESSDPMTFKVKLMGSGGCLNFSRRDYMVKYPGGYDQAMYQEMFDCQLDYFINRCIAEKAEPLSTLEDARWVTKLHNMVLEAARDEKVITVGNCEEN